MREERRDGPTTEKANMHTQRDCRSYAASDRMQTSCWCELLASSSAPPTNRRLSPTDQSKKPCDRPRDATTHRYVRRRSGALPPARAPRASALAAHPTVERTHAHDRRRLRRLGI